MADHGIALPAYTTPITGVSAAFCCLIDKSKLPVLKAFLKWNRARILSCSIPRSSFDLLAAKEGVSDEDLDLLPDRLSLQQAALYLGNLEAFRLVYNPIQPNDGFLHFAAVLALPKFAEWLLKTHDANYEAEEFRDRIPFAVACDAKPLPWSKIADSEADFRTRQKQTMKILSAASDRQWRYRGKTVLHSAIDGGLETTKAFLETRKFHAKAHTLRRP